MAFALIWAQIPRIRNRQKLRSKRIHHANATHNNQRCALWRGRRRGGLRLTFGIGGDLGGDLAQAELTHEIAAGVGGGV
jgi:hypothetical protein